MAHKQWNLQLPPLNGKVTTGRTAMRETHHKQEQGLPDAHSKTWLSKFVIPKDENVKIREEIQKLQIIHQSEEYVIKRCAKSSGNDLGKRGSLSSISLNFRMRMLGVQATRTLI